MKKMIYTKELDEQIISHEDHMLALYLEKIKEAGIKLITPETTNY